MVKLLRRPDEVPHVAKIHPRPETDMTEGAEPKVETGSLRLATAASPGGPLLGHAVDPKPVAKTAARRQLPEVGAGYFNDDVWICGGRREPAVPTASRMLVQSDYVPDCDQTAW